MIPDSVKEQIKDADLVSILQSEGLELKREGAYYKCCCPFHNEKTPSFVVHPGKNIATCFGESRSWDAIGFVREKYNMEYPEAIEYLAQKLHIQYEKREPTAEEREAQHKKEQLIRVNEAAQAWFIDQFKKAPAARDYCKQRGWDEKVIQLFGIGFAPKAGGMLKALMDQGWKRELIMEAGLAAVNDEGQYYDAFRDRIIFPIYSKTGYIAGFTGRYMGDRQDVAKYKNTKETTLFKKGEMLFGWFQARRSAKTNGAVVLCEGNPDVIRLHQIGVSNAIAPMGTALTDANIEYLKAYAETVIIAGDMDSAGREAAAKQGEALLKAGFKVRIVEWTGYDKEAKQGPKDPDEFFKLYPARWEETLATDTQDYIPWIAARKMEGKTSSQSEAAIAITEVCQLMAWCSDESAVDMYLDQFVKKYKYKKVWDQEFYKAKNARQRHTEDVDDKSREMLKEYGFYVKDNCYYGASSSGSDRRWSNFILIPVLHIKDERNAKRIYRIVNQKRQESVIKFSQSELVSFADFKTRTETAGNYIWEATQSELTQLKKYLYDDTPSADEVKQLGWQKRWNIYAWGNGCLDGNNFVPADKYGIVRIGEHRFYLPGMAADTETNTQAYMLDRRFTYGQTNEISLREYAQKLINVFGDNAKVSLCFLVATLFKDIVTGVTTQFPILNLFGPKGSGKSELGHSLSSFFVTGAFDAPNISGSTKAALAEAVAEVSNAIVHLEEFRQDIDIDRREFLKAIWDCQGRSKMDMDNNKKRITTAVDSGVIISGQQMLTHPDIALFNRVVFLPFSKTAFSDAERVAFDELKRIERRGLSHLTGQILLNRNRFQGGFRIAWEQTQEDIFRRVRSYGIEARTLQNWCTVLAAYKTLESYLDLPFDYREMLELCARMCIDQNSKTQQNNELSGFWETLETLVASSKIWMNVDYRIKDGGRPIKTKEAGKNGNVFTPHPDRRYLFINFKRVAGLYQREGRESQGKTLPSDTLKYYLEHSSEFVGTCEKVKFKLIENVTGYVNPTAPKTKVTTAMVFDYDALMDNYGISLDILTAPGSDDDEPVPTAAPVPAAPPIGAMPAIPGMEDDIPY